MLRYPEQTHVLDLFGPIFDPIGYRLDLNTYYDKEDIPVCLWCAVVLDSVVACQWF